MVQFDEYFEAMLRKADRETCARYRNCIIDEQRRRNECKNNAVQIGNNIDAQYKELARMKRWQIAFAIISLIGAFAALNIVFGASAQGLTALKVCGIILMILNELFFIRNLLRSLLLSSILKEAENTVVYVTKAPRANSDFPESFRNIPADSDEILRSKKQMLDELLGF